MSYLALAKAADHDEQLRLYAHALETNDLALFLVVHHVALMEADYDFERLSSAENWERARELLCADPALYVHELKTLAGECPTPQGANQIGVAFMRAGRLHDAFGVISAFGEIDVELLDAFYSINQTHTLIFLYELPGPVLPSDEVVDWAFAHYGHDPQAAGHGPQLDARLANMLMRASGFRLSVVERIVNAVPGALDHFYDWEVRLEEDVVGVASQFILHGRGRKLHPEILLGHPELERHAADCGVSDFLKCQLHPSQKTLALMMLVDYEITPFCLAGLVAISERSLELEAYLARRSPAFLAEYQLHVENIGDQVRAEDIENPFE